MVRSLVIIGAFVLLASCSAEETPALDSSAEAFLAGLAQQAESPPLAEPPSLLTAWRRGMNDAIPIAGDPESVEDVNEYTITGECGGLTLRTYRPVDATDGGVLYFHGGGFGGGSLDTIDTPLRRLTHQAGHATAATVLAQFTQLMLDLAGTVHAAALHVDLSNQQQQFAVTA